MQRLDESKREAILAAATVRLSNYGVKKTTMQEIARDARIAVGTLYLYFKNKNEILIAVADTYAQQHRADAAKILRSSQSVPDKLKAYLLNRFQAVKANRLSGNHAAELARTVIAIYPEFKQQEDQSVAQNVMMLLEEGVQTQVFRLADRERDGQVFLYAIGYFYPMPTTEQYYEPDADTLIQVIDWFLTQWMRSDIDMSTIEGRRST
jgi:AcrR family transcriptional regulator